MKKRSELSTGSLRKRADFIRQAVKDAIFRNETDRMREAYRLQPDSPEGAEIWELPEKWEEKRA
jgi:hypothetical protein